MVSRFACLLDLAAVRQLHSQLLTILQCSCLLVSDCSAPDRKTSLCSATGRLTQHKNPCRFHPSRGALAVLTPELKQPTGVILTVGALIELEQSSPAIRSRRSAVRTRVTSSPAHPGTQTAAQHVAAMSFFGFFSLRCFLSAAASWLPLSTSSSSDGWQALDAVIFRARATLLFFAFVLSVSALVAPSWVFVKEHPSPRRRKDCWQRPWVTDPPPLPTITLLGRRRVFFVVFPSIFRHFPLLPRLIPPVSALRGQFPLFRYQFPLVAEFT